MWTSRCEAPERRGGLATAGRPVLTRRGRRIRLLLGFGGTGRATSTREESGALLSLANPGWRPSIGPAWVPCVRCPIEAEKQTLTRNLTFNLRCPATSVR